MMIGSRIPFCLIESQSSSSNFWLKSARGCFGFGLRRFTSHHKPPSASTSIQAGTFAGLPPFATCTLWIPSPVEINTSSFASGLFLINASRPLPNPFLATTDYLLRQFFITFCAHTFRVIFTNWKSMRWSF